MKNVFSIIVIVLGVLLLKTPMISFAFPPAGTPSNLSFYQNIMLLSPVILPAVKLFIFFKFFTKDNGENLLEAISLTFLTLIAMCLPIYMSLSASFADKVHIVDNSYAYIVIVSGCVMSMLDTITVTRKLKLC